MLQNSKYYNLWEVFFCYLFLFYFLINTKWDTIHFLVKTHRDTSIPSSPSTHLPRLREIIHCKPAPINFKWFQWITKIPNKRLKRNNPNNPNNSSLIIKTFPCKIRGIFETDLNLYYQSRDLSVSLLYVVESPGYKLHAILSCISAFWGSVPDIVLCRLGILSHSLNWSFLPSILVSMDRLLLISVNISVENF